MSLTLGDLAVRFGCELRGDPEQLVTHVGSLSADSPDAVAFLVDAGYREQLRTTGVGAVILGAEHADDCPVAALIATNPHLVFARVADLLHPLPPIRPGVHPSACMAEDCLAPASCEIAAGAVLEPGVVLGERVLIGPNAVVGRNSRVGDDTRLLAGVILAHDVRVGRRCILHPGSVVGSDGFGNARADGGEWVKVPQVGSVQVGDDVEIGAKATIDRGAIGNTVIEDGVRLDNQVHVGHNVRIGRHTAIAAMTGISGSTEIGARCMIGGQVGFAGHLTIADQVVISAGTAVTNSIREPGVYGGPAASADKVAAWRRNAVRYRQLDNMAARLRKLEKRVSELIADD